MQDMAQLRQTIRSRMPVHRTLMGWIGVFPASIALIGFIVVVGLLTGGDTPAQFARVLNRFGLSYHDVRSGQIWHLFTGTYLQSDPGIAWSMLLLLVTSLLPCEYLAGSWRMLITFFASDWIGSLAMVLGLRMLAWFNIADAAQHLALPDAGSSAAAHGCLAAAIALLPRRLAFVAYGILLGVTIALLFQQDIDAAIAHLAAVLVGGGLGWFCWRPAIDASPEHAPVPDPDRTGHENLSIGRN